MGVYKRGRVWWISYAGPGGSLVRESTGQGDKGIARNMEAQRRRDVASGAWTPERIDAHVTVDGYAARWLARLEERGVKTLRSYRQRYEDHVRPELGKRVLADLAPRDVIRFTDRLKALVRAGTLSPRTAHHVYDCIRSLCREAVIDGVIVATPCILPPKALPVKRDKDPAWRATAVYTRDEVETLISSEGVAEDRRVYYALLFLLGVRPGEAVGRRWSDWDPVAKPLGRMLIATQYEGEEVKTLVPREMPVHPTLAAVLAAWKLEGWERWFLRKPAPSDFIVPSRLGGVRLVDTSWRAMRDDLRRLELRHRRQHDGRRTFISLALTDGAMEGPLRVCTHGAKGDVFSQYTTFSWAKKCEEVAKLNVGLRGLVHNMVHIGGETGLGPASFVGDPSLPGEGLEASRASASLVERRRISAWVRQKRLAKLTAKRVSRGRGAQRLCT